MFAVQIGQEVGFYRQSSWGNLLSADFGTVTKINGHGHISVLTQGETANVTRIFDKNGNQRGFEYGGLRLIEAQNLRTRLAEQTAARDRRNKAKDLENMIKSMWTYGGDFHITESRKAELKALIDAL